MRNLDILAHMHCGQSSGRRRMGRKERPLGRLRGVCCEVLPESIRKVAMVKNGSLINMKMQRRL